MNQESVFMERSGKQNAEPFVSVLTPVYNGEKYLAECIESVLNQDYTNWEYVIVNNCSTDHSLDIAEKYAQKDSRIRIHNNTEHLPLMENLNHTFRQMSPESKYCKVIHADDLLFPNCLSEMVELAEENPEVGIINSYYLENNIICPRSSPYPNRVVAGEEIAKCYLLGIQNYFGAPSNLLIRSSLIRKRENVYDPTYLQSDMSACLDMLGESDFGFVHQLLTFTRRHANSVTNTMAKKYYTYMLGDLKIHLKYGPLFLTDEVHEQVMKKRENVFYIQFARNMLSGETKEWYQLHTGQLKSVNFRVKHTKLFIYLVRESILKLISKSGYSLVSANLDNR